MSSMDDDALIQPLIEKGIIPPEEDSLENAVLDYVEMLRSRVENFQQTQNALVYCCAWLAVEQYVFRAWL